MPTCPYQLKYIIQQRGYILFCWWSAWTVDGVRTDLQTAHLAFTPDLRACSFLRLAKDFMTCWKVSALYSSYYACEVIIYWEKRCLLFLELARVSTIHISFESRILSDLCQVFGVKKSRTTPYHPMGDGLVERMNRSLLSLLHSHVDRNRDWEEHLQLSLFLYQTARHATTGLSLYKILFGTNPPSLQISNMPGVVYPDPSEYSSNLRSKILELRE